MNFSRSYNLNRNENSNQRFENLTELKHLVKSLDSKIKVNTSTSTLSMDLTASESFMNSEEFDIISNNNTSNDTKNLHLSSGFSTNGLFTKKLQQPFEVKRQFSAKKRRPRSRKNKTKFVTEDNFLYEF
ncbi:hypothetical protein M0812_24696 [Anaeramoeba flamelloides]|uniref:Uncharacterized protein n=1 Tax=Anaeramoeba flamelloides TaxID=1746091 RepID=A0AAV7YKB6_9EUKA|nr:hypothetical protein M0812_24696 [Anaeramoeba flamelloides]|eukprot:Anaeramoba_flamelloidesa586756_239.p1 GENE.a586756_239~~a586756_239.p1  ORF type:complete len:129 (+),score=19.15 a586756_239:75-461(+)